MKTRIRQAIGIAALVGSLLWAQNPMQVAFDPLVDGTQLAADRGAAGLWQALKKLHTRASLLHIVAHPDDEDGGMLTMESRGRGARVAALTLNRGEGGANVMSPDYFDALGLVRTKELLAANRYYGVQQYFSRAIDYGFSKTKEEALEKWSHERVLSDAVRVVRTVRPLVVSSVFIGGITDGHGNHQVAGQMAQEVFKAAGDPNKFPEQIREGLRAWQPLKTYGRTPWLGRISEKGLYDYATKTWHEPKFYDYVAEKWLPAPLSVQVEVSSGRYDPVLGVSYAQLARTGLGFQKSQNGGTGPAPAGEQISTYHRFGSKVTAGEKEASFYDGIDISLTGIATLAPAGANESLKTALAEINAHVERSMAEYSAHQPDRIAAHLAAGLRATNALVDRISASNLPDDAKYNVTHELRVKQAQFHNAIALALGISLLATVTPDTEPTGPMARFMGTPPTFQVAIPGQEFWVKVHVVNPSSNPVTMSKVTLSSGDEQWEISGPAVTGGLLGANRASDTRLKVKVPATAGVTRPYFTRADIEQAYYDVKEPKYLNRAHAPYPLSAWVEFTYEGVPVRIGQVVQTVKRVAGPGLVLEPLLVGPAISVAISPEFGVVPMGRTTFPVSVVIHSNVKGPAQGTVKLDLPAGWKTVPASAPFSTAKDGEDQAVTFNVTAAGLQEKPYKITAVAEYGGRQYQEGYHVIGYAGLRPYNLYRPSVHTTSGVNVKVPAGLRVGYVTGSGDEVPQSLAHLGVNVTFLTAGDLAKGDLSKFDAIVLGVRTYAVREDLKTHNSRLLDYAKNGGVVMVQYNTPEYDRNYGPYPYTMSNDPEEVTDEVSKVEILERGNPVFTWPNEITVKDFEGWVEERGSKFLKEWDPQYKPLLSTNDPGQEPQKGGLLYARTGKGVYIYNAYAFYRQLPHGVPGAYRIFANLLSLAKHPQIAPKAAAPAAKK